MGLGEAVVVPIFKTFAGPVEAVDFPGIAVAEGFPVMGARGGGKLGRPLDFGVSTCKNVSKVCGVCVGSVRVNEGLIPFSFLACTGAGCPLCNTCG